MLVLRRLVFYMELRSRFGKFFILVGITLLLLFVAADIVQVEDLNFWYLFFGVLATAFGIYLSIKGRRTQEESGRFRTVRRLTSSRKRTRGEDNEEGEEGG